MGLLEDESHEGPGVDHLAGGVAPGNPVEDHLVAVLRLVPLRKDSRVIVLENAVSNFVADEKTMGVNELKVTTFAASMWLQML